MATTGVEALPGTRRDRTRCSLLRAGLRLFSERPVDAVPIDDIVAAAAVAKGSFFNHFADKQAFAAAIAADIRLDLEARVETANAAQSDPVERLAGGMVIALDYALTQPERTKVMGRNPGLSTARDHPLNAGLRRDMEAAYAGGLVRPEAERAGLLLWLGACQMLIANTIEREFTRAQAADRMHDMMVVGLTGLGIDALRAQDIAGRSVERLLKMSTGT